MGTTYIISAGGGITKLSELQIDADKNWNGKGISNLKWLAAGMQIGDIAVFDGVRLIKLSPAAAGMVLTSQGPGNIPIWAPGGTYLDRFFPCELMDGASWIIFTPDATKNIAAPLTSPYGINDNLAPVHPEWFEDLAPEIDAPAVAAVFAADHTENAAPTPPTTEFDYELPVTAAVADDGGALTTETAAAKSAYVKYAEYATGEDTQKAISTSAWEAQTWTPGTTHWIRFVNLKIFSTAAASIRVSIKAVDGSNHPTGADLTSVDVTDFYFPSTGRLEKITFTTPILLTSGTRYALVVRTLSGSISWRCDNAGATFVGGNREFSVNSGASWAADADEDFIFEEWGTPAGDMTLLPAVAPVIGDAYYFGFTAPFPVLVADIQQAGAGTYTVAWEYSQGAGAWAACVGLVDGSNAFKNAWTQEISHTPQVDWAVDTVNGIANMLWLRARCTLAGVGYTQPLGNFARARVTV